MIKKVICDKCGEEGEVNAPENVHFTVWDCDGCAISYYKKDIERVRPEIIQKADEHLKTARVITWDELLKKLPRLTRDELKDSFNEEV